MAGNPQLLDCGHAGVVSAVCQYRENKDGPACARRLCKECYADCATCGATLCREHQVWRGDTLFGGETTGVYCPRDNIGYTLKLLAKRIILSGRKHDRQL